MPLATAQVVCRIVDNLGDAGVCWRLSRALARDHGLRVVLWIDDLAPLARIAAGVDPARDEQEIAGVGIRRLRADARPSSWPDLLVEGFGCGLPAGWPEAMAALPRPPAWINLGYLSAEDWVDGAHALPSPHPRLPLRRWFFFPGFTPATGGLLREPGLASARAAFAADPAAHAAEWGRRGLPPPRPREVSLTLFCYPHAPVGAWLDALAAAPDPSRLVVPEGVAGDAVARWCGTSPVPGKPVGRGALALVVAPWVPQDAFDRRLWLADFNVVRGEDSFVRAQWAERPFAWHIYPQEAGAQHAKLEAFLARYAEGLATGPAAALAAFWRALDRDDADAVALAWPALRSSLPALGVHARDWAGRQAALPDLATNLVRFAASVL